MDTSDTDDRDWQCSRSLVPCLDLLFTSGIACDVVFVVGENEEKITAHRTILQSRSPVFYNMFDGKLFENGKIHVPISDTSKEVYSTFLRYLYTDNIEFTVDIVIPVLALARKYFVHHLVPMCESFIKAITSPDNVCLLLEHAHKCMEESIKSECIPLVAKSEEALKSAGFMNLSAGCVKSVTDSDELLVEESVVYDAVKRWAEAECDRRGLEVTDINITEVLGDIPDTIRKTKEKIATSNSWQCCKPLVQCLDQLFTSNLACDVTFLVGEDKDKITAHKTVLLARSPIFYAMFEGLLSEKGEITIPDISKEVFLIFLRYLYTDEIDLTIDCVIPVLSVARKYFVDQLVAKCESFIKDVTTPDNVCLLLENAHCFMEDSVKTECINVILELQDSLRSAGFADLCASCVKSITELDDLLATENVVYESVVRWAEAECERQRREVTDANIREVLGDILYTVRFPIMDKEYFRQKVMLRDILTTEEMIIILRNHEDPTMYPCQDFNIVGRKQAEPVVVERFGTFGKGRWNDLMEACEGIAFTSSHSLLLHGVQVFGNTSSHSTARVRVYDKNRECIYSQKHSIPREEVYGIRLNKKIQILRNNRYMVVISPGPSIATYGKDGKQTVQMGNVTVRFSDCDSLLCNQFTDTKRGQIPGLLLSK